jgi:hypothetical protein
MQSNNGQVNPNSYLRLTLVVLVVGALAGVIGLFHTSSVVEQTTRSATNRARAAVLLAQTEDEMSDVVAALNSRVEAYLASAEFATLSPADRYNVRLELSRQDTEPGGPELPALLITASNNQSLNFQRTMAALLGRAGSLFDALPTSDERDTGRNRLTSTAAAIDAYYRQPSIRDIRLMRGTSWRTASLICSTRR